MKSKLPANGTGNEIWVRMPTTGREPHTGLTRPYLYTLISQGKIKSANIKQAGKLTGIRLIWLPSLMAFIEKHSAGAA